MPWTQNRPTAQCWSCRYRAQTRDHLFKDAPSGSPSRRSCGRRCWGGAGRKKSRWKIRDLLADGRCSQAVLDFLSTTDVGRLVPPEEDAGREVSEWERRVYREREDERRAEVEVLGTAEVPGVEEKRPLFLPTPSFMASAGED